MIGQIHRRRAMMLALGGLCSATGSAYGQARELPAELDEYFSAVLQAWDLPGGALAIVKDGGGVARGYGVRTRGAAARIDENTIFDTASLTKSFTAAMIATLVDEGAMGWDDPVRRHIPSIRFIDPWLTENITVRDFLTHRTGLAARHTLFVMTDLTSRQILDAFAGVEVAAPFRTKLIYSNIGYTVAGEAGAAAAKQTWEELVSARLLAPLGLTRSTPSFARPPRMGNCASGHDLIGGVHQVLPREPAQRRQNTAPAGAVQNSIVDLARWMLFQLGDGTHNGARIISAASMREMHAPQIIVPLSAETQRARQVQYGAAYGFGWQVWDYRGRKLLWHSGAGAGQRAYMALVPEIHLGVAVLVNSAIAGNALNGGIASRVIDHYLGLPARDYAAEFRPNWERSIARQTEERAALEEALRRGAAEPLPAPLSNYVGTFRDQLGVEIAVRAERDGLHLRYGGGEDSLLEHLSGDRFRVRWEDPYHAEGWASTADFILNQDSAAERVRLVIDDEASEGVRTQ